MDVCQEDTMYNWKRLQEMVPFPFLEIELVESVMNILGITNLVLEYRNKWIIFWCVFLALISIIAEKNTSTSVFWALILARVEQPK